MGEGKDKSEGKKTLKFDWNSRFWRVSLTLLAALLTFGGPYVVLAVFKVLDLDYAISLVSGFIVFVVGLALLMFLIKKRVIS
jgi:hypothetical protein